MSALRAPSAISSPAVVAAKPLVGQPPLLSRGHSGQLENVVAERQL